MQAFYSIYHMEIGNQAYTLQYMFTTLSAARDRMAQLSYQEGGNYIIVKELKEVVT